MIYDAFPDSDNLPHGPDTFNLLLAPSAATYPPTEPFILAKYFHYLSWPKLGGCSAGLSLGRGCFKRMGKGLSLLFPPYSPARLLQNTFWFCFRRNLRLKFFTVHHLKIDIWLFYCTSIVSNRDYALCGPKSKMQDVSDIAPETVHSLYRIVSQCGIHNERIFCV